MSRAQVWLLRDRHLHAVVEDPRDHDRHGDHKYEQGHEVDPDHPPEARLGQLPKIGDHTNAHEGQHEEELTHAFLDGNGADLGRIGEIGEQKQDSEVREPGEEVTQDEFWETVPERP